MATKKALTARIAELEKDLEDATFEVANLTVTNRGHEHAYVSVLEDRNRLRVDVERLTSSPEIKADTEAAFKRGQQFERLRVAGALRGTALSLRQISDGLEVEADTTLTVGEDIAARITKIEAERLTASSG